MRASQSVVGADRVTPKMSITTLGTAFSALIVVDVIAVCSSEPSTVLAPIPKCIGSSMVGVS